MNKLSISLLLGTLVLSAGCHSIPAAPVAQPRPVDDTYYGTTLTDPFRYFENVDKDPDVLAWFKGQAAHTRAVLDSIPGRNVLFQELMKYSNAAPVRVTDVSEVPGRIFYEARKTGENQFKLYTRTGWDGPETLLLDADTLKGADGTPVAISYYAPSPDGKYVAVGISPGGSEDASIYLFETATGTNEGLVIPRARFGVAAWKDDESGFYYIQLKERPANSDPSLIQQESQVRYHALGADPAKDPFVFGTQTPGGVAIGPEKIPGVGIQYGDPRAVAIVGDGVEREFPVYISTQAALDAGKPEWKQIISLDDDVVDLVIHGDDLYVLTHKDAPRFKMLHTKVSAPDLANADVVIPNGEAVLQGFTQAHDAIYVTTLDAGIEHLWRVPYDAGAKPVEVDLPLKGSISDMVANPRIDGVTMHLTSWTDVGGYYAYDPVANKFADTHLQPAGPYDKPDNLVAEEVLVKARDGVMIPMSIIHNKDMKLDGTNPCWIDAYGAYGIVDEPYFSPAYLPWYEHGGVYAVAHVRGSGAYGEEWHLAGKMKTKPNTWRDLIDCTQWLIDNKYTSTPKVGINGGSAGGITVGRAMTERPELFGAVVGDVGEFNPVRAEQGQNGITNIGEFGTVAKRDEFGYLLEMDSYQHVVDSVKYPPTLLTTGINDPRVPSWMPGKFAARLQQAGAPLVLLRVDFEAGHGYGSTRTQVLAELADTMAFYLWQFGDPAFQPK
jgi:prolyl oligopeptidase